MNPGATAWRTVIVDDEPLAREGIRARLTALGGFEVVSECGSGRSAVIAIQALPAREHVRIHRSAIVNVSRVRTLEALPNSELTVVLKNGVSLRASRSYAGRLRLALGLSPNDPARA